MLDKQSDSFQYGSLIAKIAQIGHPKGWKSLTFNYHLGAFGFLAREPLRTQGVFNTSLHNQRAAFAQGQAYIHLLRQCLFLG